MTCGLKGQTSRNEPTKVHIWESERGWGSKIDEIKEFPTLAEAEKFVEEYNEKHNPPMYPAPDWYMYAVLAEDNKQSTFR